jgi:hypothetical protein
LLLQSSGVLRLLPIAGRADVWVFDQDGVLDGDEEDAGRDPADAAG